MHKECWLSQAFVIIMVKDDDKLHKNYKKVNCPSVCRNPPHPPHKKVNNQFTFWYFFLLNTFRRPYERNHWSVLNFLFDQLKNRWLPSDETQPQGKTTLFDIHLLTLVKPFIKNSKSKVFKTYWRRVWLTWFNQNLNHKFFFTSWLWKVCW